MGWLNSEDGNRITVLCRPVELLRLSVEAVAGLNTYMGQNTLEGK